MQRNPGVLMWLGGLAWHPDDDRFGSTFDDLRAAFAINRNVKPFASLAQRRRLFDNAAKTGGVVGATGESAGDQ